MGFNFQRHASYVKKQAGKKLQFSISSCKFSTKELFDIAAPQFNFASTFFIIRVFRPRVLHFGRKFSNKKKHIVRQFSDGSAFSVATLSPFLRHADGLNAYYPLTSDACSTVFARCFDHVMNGSVRVDLLRTTPHLFLHFLFGRTSKQRVIISLFWKHKTGQCQKIQNRTIKHVFQGSERPQWHLQLPI